MTDNAIAILPARGGSKRIPRKNIREFVGRPAIAWPLAAARASGLFRGIFVSTDDTEIEACARELGADVPFLRDAALADDYTGTTDVIRDAIVRIGLEPTTPVCCIYPTAFFLTVDDLIESYASLEKGPNWVIALGEYRTPIDRAYRLVEGCALPRDRTKMSLRSQDLDPAYFDAGQFYWARAKTWLDPSAQIWDGAAAFLFPTARAHDIDTPEDWALAEQAMRLRQNGNAAAFSN